MYRERRIEKFGAAQILPSFNSNGKTIGGTTSCEIVEEACTELSDEFLSSLFHRIERHLDAPDGFDTRLDEERYVDKLREALDEIEAVLSNDHFTVDKVQDRKDLRKRLWSLISEIKEAHIDALYAELDRDIGLLERGSLSKEYSTEDEVIDFYEDLVDSFNDKWAVFVDSYEERFGRVTTNWEKLYDPDQQLTFYFNIGTAERCYDQQPPAICEVCDHLIEIVDYKCFNCNAPRSERNRKKYRGRIALDSIAD